ncbi:hypothetical protein AJ80_05042 [Polytolypa hystricis UAMH7299]|uniref:GTP-binding protein ypt4 n=1 Tax=Polytolypa hystricis (strain UAMH7299) TaxID=1447883 RepID=A0A2B7Y7J6_POLH7|nr:hypothetical protein AJ80_05042 [Polytolypa hystricis UAMH7299]
MSLPWDYIAKLVCIGDSGTGKSSLTIRLCEGRFSPGHDVTIGVEFGSRIVPVGPPASDALDIPGNITKTNNNNNNDNNDNNDTSTTTTTPASITASEPLSLSLPPPPLKPSASPVRQKRMKLSLWDTAGQETYKSITRSYFRGASGALLVFDISRPETFASVALWLQDLRQIAEEGIVVVLVGNKSDLAASAPPSKVVTREEAEEWCRRNKVSRYVETSAKSGDGVERAFLEVAERIYRNIEAGRYDLNDRRSGVKGYKTAGGNRRGHGQHAVTLGVNDAMRKNAGGWAGGCC